jgi:hypothetical protein
MIRSVLACWPLLLIFVAAYLIFTSAMDWPARRKRATARKRIPFLAATREQAAALWPASEYLAILDQERQVPE